MSYPGALEASFSSSFSSGGSVLRTPPKIAAATLAARPYPNRGQSPPAPGRRHASPLSDLRPIPPLHSASPLRPQSHPGSKDDLQALALRLHSEGASRPDAQSTLRTVSPVPCLSVLSRPVQDQDPRSSWSNQHGHARGTQIHGTLPWPSTQTHEAHQDRTANGVEKVKRSRKVAQGAGDKEMRFLHTFSRDVSNTVDDGSAGVSLPLPVVDWPAAQASTRGFSAPIRGGEIIVATKLPVGATGRGGDSGGMEGQASDPASHDPLSCPPYAKGPVDQSEQAPGRGQEYGDVDELVDELESDAGRDIWAGRSVARGQLSTSDSHGVHEKESPPPASRAGTSDFHVSDGLKSAPQPLHPTKAGEGMRPDMPIHGSRKYGRMQDHTFRVAPLRPIELPSYCDPPAQAPSGSEAHIVGSALHENAASAILINPPRGSTEPLAEHPVGPSPTGEQMYWMFDTSGKTFIGYDGRIPHRTRGQRGRPRGQPRGPGRGGMVADMSGVNGADPDVAMRMPNEYVSSDLTS
jgi:hypothetical protein